MGMQVVGESVHPDRTLAHTPHTTKSWGGGVYDGVSLGQVVGESVHPDRTLTHGS